MPDIANSMMTKGEARKVWDGQQTARRITRPPASADYVGTHFLDVLVIREVRHQGRPVGASREKICSLPSQRARTRSVLISATCSDPDNGPG
jgi:hypothetical protein